MYQKKSNPWARLKYAYVLPLAAITVALFARPEVSQSFDEISNAKVSHFALETSKNEVKNLPEVVIFETPSAENLPSYATYPPYFTENDTEAKFLPIEKAAEWQAADDSIYNFVEKQPEFPGGADALLKYIQDNIVYPSIAKEIGIQGRTVCKIVINKDGSVSDVEVSTPSSPYLDKEAIRVLKTLPKFKPGEQMGQPVRVYYFIPVIFELPSNEKPVTSGRIINEAKEKEFPGGQAALLKFIQDNFFDGIDSNPEVK